MNENQNPFLSEYHTPHQTVPFHLIRTEHFEPAILQGMEEHDREIADIIANPDEPTFENTIEALELSGERLDRVTTVFGNLLSAETNDDMQAIAERIMPKLSEHSNNITLNEQLFARIKHVYQHTDKASLSTEQQMLLQNTYDGFIRSGANLTDEQKERFRQRFMHKLVYFPANNGGEFGCVGCGRCLNKCPISMNIVKVMKTLKGEN